MQVGYAARLQTQLEKHESLVRAARLRGDFRAVEQHNRIADMLRRQIKDADRG
jgi:hypothetical protein